MTELMKKMENFKSYLNEVKKNYSNIAEDIPCMNISTLKMTIQNLPHSDLIYRLSKKYLHLFIYFNILQSENFAIS